MNRQFDVIIVGDSKVGNTIVKGIAGSNRSIKVAFISRDFKNTTTHDYLNVEYIKGEATFTDYNNRLFCCYLNNGERHYCTHLIIAAGLSYAPIKAGKTVITSVFNTVDEIPKASKQQVAVAIGHREADVKLALAVAKKFKYVYLCTEAFELDISAGTRKKLEAVENILVLPNASIVKAAFTDGVLTSVDLDNYTTITCNALFAKTKATPETSFVSEKLIDKDNEGYLKTNEVLESVKVPKCFAAGSCTRKSTKKQITALIDAVLKDF